MKKITLILLTLLLSISLFGADAVENAYYNSDYQYLDDPASVYDSVTFEEAAVIFSQEGRYLFLLGGSWCGNTSPVIGYINEVAKEYGVEAIYNLDFRLDGVNADTHIREDETSSRNGARYNYAYGELVSRFLTNLDEYIEYKSDTDSSVTYTDSTGVKHTVGKVQVPFLFIYDKDNLDEEGNPAPIVAGLELMTVRSDYVNEDGSENTEAVEDYKSLLRESVFSHIGAEGLTPFTDGDYIRLIYNEKSGEEIFAPEEDINLVTLTYHQLKWLLEQEGKHIIFLGGSWCGNTRAVIKLVNDFAVENGVTIYTFDTKLDGAYPKFKWGYTEDLHIRDNNSPFVSLYTDLVNDYLLNIETEYTIESGNYIHYTDAAGNEVIANKLQVPFLFTYEKGAEDENGHDTPILAYIEKMYTLNEEADDYIYKAENYNTYVDGIESVLKVYEAETAPEVTAIPAASPAEAVTAVQQKSDNTAQSSGISASARIIALLVVIIIILIVVLALVLKKKKKEPEKEE